MHVEGHWVLFAYCFINTTTNFTYSFLPSIYRIEPNIRKNLFLGNAFFITSYIQGLDFDMSIIHPQQCVAPNTRKTSVPINT